MPTAEPIPVDRVLDLWASGVRMREIRKLVRRSTGQAYSDDGIRSVVIEARKRGDPRAVYRRKPQPPLAKILSAG